ncbi:hypothetical protein PBRA_008752 [Plasmodiophora brassicae]|nr:hypothetical protein PBRA_008752 [Plasmodiophora brassicae]
MALALPWSRRDAGGMAVFATMSAVAAGLGVWQVQRRQQKVEMIEARRLSLEQAPRQLDEVARDWTPVRLPAGRFLKPSLVGPRGGPARVVGTGASGSGGISAGGLGYYVIAPLEMSDGSVVLVNRGWVPMRFAEQMISRLDDSVNGNACGVVRPDESAGGAQTAPSGNLGEGVWIRVDGGAICSHLGLKQNTLSLGRVVDLVGGETDGPFRRSLEDYVQFPTSPLTHSAYAFTWFSLSAAMAVMTAFRFRRRRRTV